MAETHRVTPTYSGAQGWAENAEPERVSPGEKQKEHAGWQRMKSAAAGA